MNHKPYIPRPWQLPHMLGTPAGGKVLIVERCEYPIEQDGDWIWFMLPDGSKLGQHKDDDVAKYRLAKAYCPLGPVGTVLGCKETWAYITDNDGQYLFPASKKCLYRVDGEHMASRWRSSTAMPRAFCRLFYRTTAVDLRRVDSMTREESATWGCTPDGYWRDEAEGRWLADNPGATWGDWVWFITAERVERA